jgi:hypothetical protein
VSAERPPGYRTQSEDTSYAAERVLVERWRSMGLDEKAALTALASRDLHTLCVAGLKHRLPAASALDARRWTSTSPCGWALAMRPRCALPWRPSSTSTLVP